MSAVANALPGVPDVESPLFETLFQVKNLPPETISVARHLRQHGFAVIDFPEPEFEALTATIIKKLDNRYDWDGWRKGKAGLRIQDAWNDVPEVKKIATNPAIRKLLADLYGRAPIPFQTLNFPVGTEQHFHSDSIHFSCCPERFMAGVWLAFEDIDSDNGPLIYYPGSHTLPIFTNEQIGINPDTQALKPPSIYPAYEKAWQAIVSALDLKPLEFHAKKGQALIWAANLLHGGAAQRDKNRTRYSQVTHYYFEGCCYYTPMKSVPFLGPIDFRDIVNIETGRHVPNVLNGTAVSREQLQHAKPRRHKVRPTNLPPGFDKAAYLRANPDVAAAGADPARHYLEFGYFERRPLQ